MSILLCPKCRKYNVVDMFGKRLRRLLNIEKKLSTYQYKCGKYLVFLKYRCIFFLYFPTEYYGAAEPPVRCGESHLSGLTEPPHFVY